MRLPAEERPGFSTGDAAGKDVENHAEVRIGMADGAERPLRFAFDTDFLPDGADQSFFGGFSFTQKSSGKLPE
jgi:hypothetical protein